MSERQIFNNFQDSIPLTDIIGGVAIYPADDAHHISKTSSISRDIVDRYCHTIKGTDLLPALLRALARRLTAPTGGETIQNINMLNMLCKIANNEPIRETDPLACDTMINPITGNPID